jgi:uncharacterized membrane protein
VVGAIMKKLPWIVFALLLVFAIGYIVRTAPHLPPLVASHFNGAGYPSAYMTRGFYTKFTLAFGVGLPAAIVALLSLVYSRTKDVKLPNRDYWLAPERIAQTRSVLVSFGAWLGSLMVAMVCYAHWLILVAHRSVTPHFSRSLILGGLLAFALLTGGLLALLLMAFRLPRSDRRGATRLP